MRIGLGACVTFLLAGVSQLALSTTEAQAADPPAAAIRPAQPPQNELARALFNETTFTLHLRSYYLDRDTPTPPGLGAWAGGGWLGYQSGWLANFLQIGAVGYTSLPLWGPMDRDGTLLLAPGQEGYAVLGQAYVSLKLWDQIFTGFRQAIDQPEVNSQDNRMTPNTFEAYTARGEIGFIRYFAGYLDKMKTRNEDTFRNFADVAGVKGASSPLWLGTLQFVPTPDFDARVSTYHVPDIIHSVYGDFVSRHTVTELVKLRFSGQAMYQTSTGDNLLTGSSFDTWVGGLKADLIVGPVTASVAYNQTGSEAAYRSPYGSWPGYTSMIVKDFNRANEHAIFAGAAFDLASMNLPGFVVTANAAFGRDAINPATLAPLSDNNEYDFTVDYRFTDKMWPEWLRPLWIRARAARVEERLNGVNNVTNDYRVIVNYEWVFRAAP